MMCRRRFVRPRARRWRSWFSKTYSVHLRAEAPLLVQASRTYKIPLVQHDFPLPGHNWSFEAAVLARYFDTHSKDIGDEFRETVFAHQMEINPQNLRAFAEKFAAEHKIGLPFVVDPDGKLAGMVRADKDVGMGLHIDHTPTIWLVSSKPGGSLMSRSRTLISFT